MGAADGGLDQTGAIAVAAAGERQQEVARVGARQHCVRIDVAPRTRPPCDDVTYDCAQLVVGHGITSTVSMIPTIAASTGAPFFWSTSPAARPSSTISTFS